METFPLMDKTGKVPLVMGKAWTGVSGSMAKTSFTTMDYQVLSLEIFHLMIN